MEPQIERFSYDSIAAQYAERVDTAPYNALYERPAMLAELPAVDGARVLDAGCGSGWYSGQLLERGALVDAIDASAEMVNHARRRLASFDSGALLSIRTADLAERLPFDDEKFDGIVSPLVLHYMEDWRPPLREMHRVLATDGWLLLSTHHPAADAALFDTKDYFRTERVVDYWEWVGNVEFYRRSLTEIHSSVADSGFVIERLIEPVPTPEFRALNPEAYQNLMRQPAFLIIRARKKTDDSDMSH